MKMTESLALKVTGMKCGGCENNVTTKLKSIEGVQSATASSKEQAVKVEFDTEKTNRDAIVKAIAEAGYDVVEG
jgi:copper chaperone